MAKLLVVDDEPDIYQLIRRFAEHEGYETAGAGSGAEAVALCREQDFDLIIMDVMMPDMDGFTACKEIRRRKDVPVLMLSARGAEYDKLLGFEAGVDDYVVKPFSPRELMARINVIISRRGGRRTAELTWRGVKVDTLGRTVTVDGENTVLTAKEYDLLLYLLEHRGAALSRDQILNAVWGYDCYGDERTVDWQIKLLRGKLGSYRNGLVTLRGVGYKLET